MPTQAQIAILETAKSVPVLGTAVSVGANVYNSTLGKLVQGIAGPKLHKTAQHHEPPNQTAAGQNNDPLLDAIQLAHIEDDKYHADFAPAWAHDGYYGYLHGDKDSALARLVGEYLGTPGLTGIIPLPAGPGMSPGNNASNRGTAVTDDIFSAIGTPIGGVSNQVSGITVTGKQGLGSAGNPIVLPEVNVSSNKTFIVIGAVAGIVILFMLLRK